MRKLLWLLLVGLIGCGVWADEKKEWSLEPYFASPEAVWQITAPVLLKDNLFKWTSNQKEQLRYATNESDVQVKLWDCKVDECLISFYNDKVVGVTVLFLSRGDSGYIDRETFFDVLDPVKAAVGKLWGKPQPQEVCRLEADKKMNILRWTTSHDTVQLIWSYTGKTSSRKDNSFAGEYVKLSVTSAEMPVAKKTPATLSGRRDLRSNLVRNSGGDVLIENIPMVDQGMKGYCVVATAERVLRYYGEDIDQHVLAQVSDTSRAGTQLEKMQEAMNRLEKRFHFRHRSLYLQKPAGSSILKKIYDAYNDIARKKGKTRYSFAEFTQLLTDTEEAENAESQLDYEVFMEVKKKIKKSEYRHFVSDIQAYVNQGIPCVWSVVLGLVREKNLPQVSGGHQRLIIGYNLRKNLVYYSDSWGNGHEKKSMTMDEAWTITMALDVYIPMAEKR